MRHGQHLLASDYLRHVLQKHIGWDLVARVCSETVLQVVEVEAETDEPADGLARHAAAGPVALDLAPRGEHTLEHGPSSATQHTQHRNTITI